MKDIFKSLLKVLNDMANWSLSPYYMTSVGHIFIYFTLN